MAKKNKTTWKTILLISLFLAIPSISLAFEFKGGEGVIIGKEEVINDDVFVVGNNITVEGTINGDLKAAGSNITINGEINGDVMTAGGQITLRGKIADDIIAAGGTVICDSEISDNAMMAGGNVIISDKAKIGRDLMIAGGNILLSSAVGRNASLGGGTATVNSKIGGNLTANINEELTLLSKTEIGGDFSYTAPREAKIESGAKILGKTAFTPSKVAEAKKKPFISKIGFKLFNILSLMFSSVVVVLFLTRPSRKIISMINSKPGKSFGIGLIICLLAPTLILLLVITLLGIPLAVILIILLIVALYLAKIFVGLWIGNLILESIKKQEGKKEIPILGAAILGTLLLGIILSIPFVGFLIKIAVCFLGVGAMGTTIYEALKPARLEKKAVNVK